MAFGPPFSVQENSDFVIQLAERYKSGQVTYDDFFRIFRRRQYKGIFALAIIFAILGPWLFNYFQPGLWTGSVYGDSIAYFFAGIVIVSYPFLFSTE